MISNSELYKCKYLIRHCWIRTTHFVPRKVLLIALLALLAASSWIILAALFNKPTVPLIIVITPTIKNPRRIPDMTRLSQTLRQVKRLKWIVIESGNRTLDAISRLLKRSGINYVYINAQTPVEIAVKGWAQRNAGLTYLREMYDADHEPAVVYFADDDNSYDLRLFDEYIRNVKKIGFWAVGFAGDAKVEAPRVRDNVIVGWDVDFGKYRKYGTDMAGFALGLDLILQTNATFHRTCDSPETCFLEQLPISPDEMQVFGWDREPKDLLVWHTRTTVGFLRGGTHGYVYETNDNPSVLEWIKQMTSGFAGDAKVETPEVRNNVIVGWNVEYGKYRKYGTDMAGFALGLDLILQSNATFHRTCVVPETCFLEKLPINPGEMQVFGWDRKPKDLLVWHTQTSVGRLLGDSYGYVFENESRPLSSTQHMCFKKLEAVQVFVRIIRLQKKDSPSRSVCVLKPVRSANAFKKFKRTFIITASLFLIAICFWPKPYISPKLKVQPVLKKIIVITSTIQSPKRIPDLTRFWIVIEDGKVTVDAVERLLNRSGINYIYTNAETPIRIKVKGWAQRNAGLTYLREMYDADHEPAVVYFADDDNSYDLRLFDEYIRNVKKIGFWAVGEYIMQ
uniref:Galactosylgalactosylxylosylprotein 3-beta-glucuronosyltransferase n=2 Tax=Syphacia muris TaxID=451379 RepID=A0A0N5AZV7_9BILA